MEILTQIVNGTLDGESLQPSVDNTLNSPMTVVFKNKDTKTIEIGSISKAHSHVHFFGLGSNVPESKTFNIIDLLSVLFLINCVFGILYFKLVNHLKSICLDRWLHEEPTISIRNFWNDFDGVFQSHGGSELEILKRIFKLLYIE